MKRIKSGMLCILIISLMGNQQQVQAVDFEDVKLFGTIALATITSCGIGYGFYKAYESISLNNARKHLKRYEIQSSKIVQHARYAMSFDAEQLVATYYNRLDEYANLCRYVNHDVQILTDMQTTIDNDIASWDSTEKADTFVAQARLFSEVNRQRLKQIAYYAEFLNKQAVLIKLVRLLDEEVRTSCYRVVYAATQQSLDEATARAYNAQSAWPLRAVWKDLEQRKQLYQQYVYEFASDSMQSHYVNNIIQSGYNTIAAYEQAQRTIAGFASYTGDIRAEKDFELREEQARQARIQAEAARLAAEAQERQARAQEKQIRQQKEHELAALRSELSILKQRIADGDNGYYIQQQKQQLQNRISQLKSQLYGPSSLFGVFFEVLADKD
ncbi:MAG: hypothetical protein WC707_06140 [Candidatus Babeliaceae bacterium]|jgi:hypothetical protein